MCYYYVDNCGEELNTTSPRTISWTAQNELHFLCIWRIKNHLGGKILLTVEELRLKRDYGLLLILDGPDCDAKPIQNFKGVLKSKAQTISSSSNVIIIVLTGTADSLSSFRASFEFGEVTNTMESISAARTHSTASTASSNKPKFITTSGTKYITEDREGIHSNV
ncbi:unnamed protein product [Dicrocoelium dendriticum]|nr:unnamed protein product [Dicrocoelium dendriticum]